MNEFRLLILVLFFPINSLDKAKSVKLELKTFDEIFGEGWWDKGEAEDLKMPAPTNFGQNVHHQIDRQNTQIGQIEPNGQIEENIVEDERKRKIIDKFHAIKDEFKQKGKYSDKERVQIEEKIAKYLKVTRSKIYKWKRELDLSRKAFYEKEERKHLIEKFDQMKADLKRAGFKNSYPNQINKTIAKELGVSDTTIYNWKSELGQTTQNYKYSHSEQMELMKRYYVIKDKNPKINDKEIVKLLEIGIATLVRWKRQFKRQQFHPNSAKNAAENVQAIGNSNLGII